MKKEEIEIKANNILEETKNKKEEYCIERNIIFKLLNNLTESNLEMLEAIIKIYDKNEKIRNENEKYRNLISLKEKIEIQKIRKNDREFIEKIVIFSIKDKDGKKYKFLARENANEFILNNANKFVDEVNIEIETNEYLDLEGIFKN